MNKELCKLLGIEPEIDFKNPENFVKLLYLLKQYGIRIDINGDFNIIYGICSYNESTLDKAVFGFLTNCHPTILKELQATQQTDWKY